MTRKTNLANASNYGGTRSAGQIQYIVLHMTGNDGDHDESNGNYFKNNVVKASAHYFVDDDSVTQSVPELSVAYAVGGKKYKDTQQTGGGSLYGKVTNGNSISVELCDTQKDGEIMPTEQTVSNGAEVVKELMDKYQIPLERVCRHFDVTGKHCPVYWMDETAWTGFKARLQSVKTVSTPNDIAYRLKKEGILTQTDYWMKRMEQEPTVRALCQNIANYTLKNSKGKCNMQLINANDVAYHLLKAGVVTDSLYWRQKMTEDQNLLVLGKKAVEWIG